MIYSHTQLDSELNSGKISFLYLIYGTENYIIENDLKKCRDMKGRYFNIEEIEFVKVRPHDYANKRMIQEDEIPSNIIIKDLKLK